MKTLQYLQPSSLAIQFSTAELGESPESWLDSKKKRLAAELGVEERQVQLKGTNYEGYTLFGDFVVYSISKP